MIRIFMPLMFSSQYSNQHVSTSLLKDIVVSHNINFEVLWDCRLLRVLRMSETQPSQLVRFSGCQQESRPSRILELSGVEPT